MILNCQGTSFSSNLLSLILTLRNSAFQLLKLLAINQHQYIFIRISILMAALKRKQMDSAYRKTSLFFAGWETEATNQKPLDPQEFVTKQILYKSFLFVKNLRLLRNKYKELANNRQLIEKADRYIQQMSKVQINEKIKRVWIISIENAKAQIQMGDIYIKKIQQQEGKMLSWVEDFYDFPGNLQMKHLEKAKPLRNAFSQSIFTDQILRGYCQDYLQSKQLIDEIYQKFMYDVEMIKIFINEPSTMQQRIIETIKHLGEKQ